MESIVHAFSGAGVVSAGYFALQVFLWLRRVRADRAETKAAIANDAERVKEQEFEDRISAIVKDLLERKALPPPTPEAQ